MKVVPVLAIGLAGTLAVDAASAEWSGKGRVSGVIGRGNTETATANLNVDVQNELNSWKHKFEQQLTPNTRMFNRLLVESGVLNTFAQNVLGLDVKMTQALSLGAGYEVRYNSQVLTLGLAVSF